MWEWEKASTLFSALSSCLDTSTERLACVSQREPTYHFTKRDFMCVCVFWVFLSICVFFPVFFSLIPRVSNLWYMGKLWVCCACVCVREQERVSAFQQDAQQHLCQHTDRGCGTEREQAPGPNWSWWEVAVCVCVCGVVTTIWFGRLLTFDKLLVKPVFYCFSCILRSASDLLCCCIWMWFTREKNTQQVDVMCGRPLSRSDCLLDTFVNMNAPSRDHCGWKSEQKCLKLKSIVL